MNAIELTKKPVAHLQLFKEKDFKKLFIQSKSLCEEHDFSLNKLTKGRNSKNQTFDEADYLNKFNIIIDKFIEEIQERFQSANYEPVIELFKLITNNNIEKKANFEKLQLYKNFLDFDNLKLQEEAFIIYKNKFKDIEWNSMKDLCFNFLEKKLDSFFQKFLKQLKFIYPYQEERQQPSVRFLA